MRAIGYVRASTNVQEAYGFSMDDQSEAIERFCREHKIELLETFVEAESGATIANRPKFKQALLTVYTDPTVGALIVTNVDRHSRSVLDAELIKRGLAKRNKRLISVQEQYLTPVHDVDPEFEEYLEAALQHRMVEAEQERKRFRRRSLRGKKAKQAKGGWIGFRPPYEYDVIQGDLVRNFERSCVRRLIFRLRFWLKWSYRKIAEYLNGSNRRGRIFPPCHARKPLRERQKPTKTGTGKWSLFMVYNFIVRTKDWSLPEHRGVVRAL